MKITTILFCLLMLFALGCGSAVPEDPDGAVGDPADAGMVVPDGGESTDAGESPDGGDVESNLWDQGLWDQATWGP